MKLIFVTSNKEKIEEANKILEGFELENINLDLPELQGERNIVVKEKAKLAAEKLQKSCFVEDTSLCFEALKGLPGVYIREFSEKLGREGLVNLLAGHENKNAEAVAMIGYCEPGKDPVCFEGKTKGTIVNPRGDRFWWDPIFQPEGHNKTFAEMTIEQKNIISHRKKALEKFREFLNNQD